jgi:DNA-binding LacI/PurR family transcriptional regulator
VPDDGPSLVAVLQRSLPVVVCDQPQLDGAADVGIDDHAAIRSLGAHPIGLGHPQPISRTVMLPTKLVVRNTSGRAAS